MQSGVSVRVVSKAEAGAAVSTSTIDKFAFVLSTAKHEVFPEDLISYPVELSKQFVTAMHVDKHRMMDVVGALIEPDALFRVSGNPKTIPFAGTHRGPRAFRRAMAKFFEIFEFAVESDRATAYEFFPKGTDVVLWGASFIRPINSKIEPERVEHRLRFRYRRGLLHSFEDRYDTQKSEKSIADAADVLGSGIYDPLEDSGLNLDERTG